ncbi:hypothetical protein [Mangrovimonas sp. DI 80]|uniref:hypothetical protein n=1 Tax=Mangrovimonas sp. DI 80 TaxID=1779330 RepID=UPI0009777D51|nr:hypothetical protein [Mangrovimonas sp. DI 80]OMP31626.1 hypothetical protein BKM32_00695 [Mangrovimonas sp. DI 80]
MRKILALFSLILILNCSNNNSQKDNRKFVFKANREAPIGWVYLDLYADSSFDLRFNRRGKPNSGKYQYIEDTIYLKYDLKQDVYRSKAIINKNNLCFINDSIRKINNVECTELLEITLNNLIKQ